MTTILLLQYFFLFYLTLSVLITIINLLRIHFKYCRKFI